MGNAGAENYIILETNAVSFHCSFVSLNNKTFCLQGHLPLLSKTKDDDELGNVNICVEKEIIRTTGLLQRQVVL